MNDPEEQFVCPQCGTTVYEADKVCPKCGTLLDWSVDLNDAAVIAKPGMNEPYVAPMSLGDIFDRTFRLFGRVFSRSIIIVLILYIPISILLVKGAQEFYATIGEITARGQGAAPGSDEVLTMLGWMGLFGISVLLAFLASLCGELAVTNLVRSEFTGSSMTWKGAFMEGIGIRFLRAAGVVGLEVVLVVIAGVGVAVLSVALAATGSGGAFAIVLIFLAAMCFGAFLFIRWALAFTVIACEDHGVLESFKRSWGLVSNRWWRVFGILLLMGLLVNFAIFLLTAPFTFIAMWGFYREYFSALSSAGTGQPDPTLMGKAMASMGPAVGLSMALNMMLSTLTKPVYMTVLYFDLCARKKEADAAYRSLPSEHQGDQPFRSLPEGRE